MEKQKKEIPDEVEIESKRSLGRLLLEIHSPVSLDDLWPEMQSNSVYQDVIQHWSSWAENYRERRWEALCREMEKAAYGTRPYCLQCGDCCRQGSPTLYLEDLPILRKGSISRTNLMTLRLGEIGFSNVTQDLVLLPEERIKIKEKTGSRECLFLDPETNGCRIYEDRPLQCRVMECWNPDNFQALNLKVFLSRKELLNPDDPLVPVIESYNKRCSVPDLQKALTRAKRGFDDARDEVLEILLFDQHLREYLDKERRISLDNQIFLLGRSISDLIYSFGFRIEEGSDGKLKLVYTIEDKVNQNPKRGEGL